MKAPDALAAAVQPLSDEPHEDSGSSLAAPMNEKDSERIEKAGSSDDDEIQNEPIRPQLAATKSYATDTSVATGLTTPPAHNANKPWYKNLNPLRWGAVPPIPKERIVSREYKAGFFSRMTFQWMGPLMAVSLIPDT